MIIYLHYFSILVEKNNSYRGVSIRIVSKKFIQPYHFSICPNLLYPLFDKIIFNIFCFKTKVFGKIEHMLDAKLKIGVSKNDCSQ